MKLCPHCGKEVRFWRVWQTGTIYQCPSCDRHSRIALSSQVLFTLIVVLPVLALGVSLLAYLDVQSWVVRILVIVPIAFAASLLLKYLLACFGRFEAFDRQA
jgi:uncharacterized protein (DUF983 family)